MYIELCKTETVTPGKAPSLHGAKMAEIVRNSFFIPLS